MDVINTFHNLRDSRQEWLGMIPNEWRLSRIGSLYTLRNTKVSDKDYPPLSVTMKGIVPQLETAAKTDDGDNRKLVKVGDFAINSRSDRRGSCGISPYDGSVSLINTVLTPKDEMHPGYYNWLFHTVAFADEFYKWGHGIVNDLWTTRWQEMKRIVVPVPPLSIQKSISIFLDERCKKIDAIINEMKKSVDDYRKWRASIISETITRGIDLECELCGSGVDWIGEIPSSWQVKKIKYFGSQLTFRAESNEGYIGLENVESATGRYLSSKDKEFMAEGTSLKVEKGDVLFGKLRPYLAKCIIADSDACCSTEFIVIKPCGCDARYLKYIMLSPKFIDVVNMSTYGAKMPRANWDFIGNIKTPFPPKEVQTEIVEELEKKLVIIDELIAEKIALIDDLEVYKKSIIYETVTGKRKVV